MMMIFLIVSLPLPRAPGIYLIWHHTDGLLYLGKTKDMR
jgi:excinuclease UvrABC nuclease subunit